MHFVCFFIALFIHGCPGSSLLHQRSRVAVSVVGSSPVVVPGFVTAVAPLVAEHGLSVVAVRGLGSYGSRA